MIRRILGWISAIILAILLVTSLIFLISILAPKALSEIPSVGVPLVDRAALAAHADSAGVPRAGAYALAWMESRSGACLPRCPRGQGIVVADSLGPRRTCREVGRMQINPCARLDRYNPRCAFLRVLTSVDDNYACGLWYYSTLRGSGERAAFSRYNGGNPAYAKDALAQAGDWWFAGFLTAEDR
jgi:hypothetical protein